MCNVCSLNRFLAANIIKFRGTGTSMQFKVSVAADADDVSSSDLLVPRKFGHPAVAPRTKFHADA